MDKIGSSEFRVKVSLIPPESHKIIAALQGVRWSQWQLARKRDKNRSQAEPRAENLAFRLEIEYRRLNGC